MGFVSGVAQLKNYYAYAALPAGRNYSESNRMKGIYLSVTKVFWCFQK